MPLRFLHMKAVLAPKQAKAISLFFIRLAESRRQRGSGAALRRLWTFGFYLFHGPVSFLFEGCGGPEHPDSGFKAALQHRNG